MAQVRVSGAAAPHCIGGWAHWVTTNDGHKRGLLSPMLLPCYIRWVHLDRPMKSIVVHHDSSKEGTEEWWGWSQNSEFPEELCPLVILESCVGTLQLNVAWLAPRLLTWHSRVTFKFQFKHFYLFVWHLLHFPGRQRRLPVLLIVCLIYLSTTGMIFFLRWNYL